MGRHGAPYAQQDATFTLGAALKTPESWGWHSAGYKNPLLATGRRLPAPKYLEWTGGTRRVLHRPINMACPEVPSSTEEHAWRKANASHFLCNCNAPSAMGSAEPREPGPPNPSRR